MKPFDELNREIIGIYEKWKKTCKWLYDRYKIQEREGK